MISGTHDKNSLPGDLKASNSNRYTKNNRNRCNPLKTNLGGVFYPIQNGTFAAAFWPANGASSSAGVPPALTGTMPKVLAMLAASRAVNALVIGFGAVLACGSISHEEARHKARALRTA